MRKENILVIGGGPSGCAAAWEASRRGHRVTLVEAKEKLGGMASNRVYNGNPYEYGTHVFHTHNADLLEQVRDLMGPSLLEIERESKLHIKFWGRYFVYPLQGLDLLRKLPPRVAVFATLSFLKSLVLYDFLLRGRRPENTEEYLIQKFGKVLYNEFFKDYSEKVWGIPCSEIDPIFGMQRIPRTDVFSFFKKLFSNQAFSRLFSPHPLSESVIGNIYYTERGVGRIFEKIGEEITQRGAAVLTRTKLKRLVIENGRAAAVILEGPDGELELKPDVIVTTIPLPDLMECLGPETPSQVIQAGRQLLYRSLAVVGMLVAKPQVRPAYLTYFKTLSFNRLSEPTNHGLQVTPRGHSLLLAETICGYEGQAYRGDGGFRETVLNDLEREGLVSRNEIVEHHHYAWRYAYPLYSLCFSRHLEVVHSYLHSLGNLYPTGRHGNFNYVNMHIAMQMGIECVQNMGKDSRDSSMLAR